MPAQWLLNKIKQWKGKRPTASDFNFEDELMEIDYNEALNGDLLEDLVLRDAVIYVFDETLQQEAYQIANILGAMITDEIVPNLTTHVIADAVSPLLFKQLHGQLNDLNNQTRGAVYKTQYQVTTLDWLRDCLKYKSV